MTTYLDKEEVLKELKIKHEHCCTTASVNDLFIEKIERGKFDANEWATFEFKDGGPHRNVVRIYLYLDGKERGVSLDSIRDFLIWCDQPNKGEKTLAEKDAEIARLQKALEEKYDKYADTYTDLRKVVEENAELESRIADLEKLCDMQKTTPDQQGKALREALETIRHTVPCDGCHPKPCSGCQWELERCKYRRLAKGDHHCRYFKEHREDPAQKEPEWFICPKHAECNIGCWHSGPHEKYSACGAFPDKCPKCIPVKLPIPQPSPVPTSGTENTVRERCNTAQYYMKKLLEGMKEIEQEQQFDDLKCPTCGRYSEECDCEGISPQVVRFLDILNKKGVSAEYNEEDRKKLGEAIWEVFGFVKERTYPGMAKDIGNLTLRVDALENWHRNHMDTHKLLNNNNQELNLRIGKLEKEVKDQREDYHAHIRQLVEENGKAHKNYDKLLKRKSNP